MRNADTFWKSLGFDDMAVDAFGSATSVPFYLLLESVIPMSVKY
jgi:hypothetical protein